MDMVLDVHKDHIYYLLHVAVKPEVVMAVLTVSVHQDPHIEAHAVLEVEVTVVHYLMSVAQHVEPNQFRLTEYHPY